MIKDNIGELIEIDWMEDLLPLQPDNVKIPYNYEYLKKTLLKYGFARPFAVWLNEGKCYTIDGHTRKDILIEMIADGIEVPQKLKAYTIKANTKEEAIKILVEVYNQKHNPFAEEILTEWLEVEDVELIEIDGVNVASNLDFSDKNTEIDIDDLDNKMVIKLTYTEDEYLKVKEALSFVASTPEQAVYKLLKLDE